MSPIQRIILLKNLKQKGFIWTKRWEVEVKRVQIIFMFLIQVEAKIKL